MPQVMSEILAEFLDFNGSGLSDKKCKQYQ
jgi:hypothetical protein